MKTLRLLSAVVFVGLMASCSITTPVTMTNNDMGTKVGVATNNCLSYGPPQRLLNGELIPVSGGWCFNDKKYSVADAARDGGISRVATVDLKITNYVFFYKYELIVTGE